MNDEDIKAIADYFTGSAVADASICLALPAGPRQKRAQEFFAARMALGIEGYHNSVKAERILRKKLAADL